MGGTMKVIKVTPATFTGDDGLDVTGQYFYLVPTDGQTGRPERVFISDSKKERMDFLPKFGDVVYVFKNSFDKVQEFVKV